jgi:peptidoglycan/LPS O-acetylase OafA/YrhL/CubicO group peptidase (beta-lactamase class C family)
MGKQAIHATAQRARVPYLAGLDGLRALAVLGVVLYHVGVALPGGFLGVEVFFTLSGFLITSLLFAEWRERGTVGLRDFWARRARRLLPALFLVLIGTLVFTALVLAEELPGLVDNALAALTYIVNWQLIASGQSYFDPMERPPLLQHLWSLAVEEQFYLFWPLLFLGGMRVLRRRGMVVAALAGALASAAAMALWYEPGVDPSRLYYGTDTRAAGLLLGSALALIWVPGSLPQPESRRLGRALDAAGLLACLGLGTAMLLLDAAHPRLYHGGFFATSVLTLVLVVAVSHPQSRLLARALGWWPLQWIGVRSYSIYLWHWPVFSVTRPGLDVALDGWQLLVVRIAMVVALADLSYRCVEQPLRRVSYAGVWRRARQWLQVPQLAPSFAMSAAGADRSAMSATSATSAIVVQRTPILKRVGSLRRRWRKSRARPHLARGRRGRSTNGGGRAPQPAISGSPGLLRWTNLLMASVLLITTATCASTGGAVAFPTGASVAASPAALASGSATTTASPQELAATPELASAPTATTLVPSATAVPTSAPLPAIDGALAAELQRILDQTVADGSIPGASLAVSIPGYQTWTGTSGVADRDSGVPMTPETRMRIASISKMFTSVVVLQLAEEGRLSLDAPLSTWFPDLVPNAEAITVRMLLSHTSGLYDYLEDSKFTSQAYADPERIWKPEELVAYAAEQRTSFAPGAADRWDYSSTNYVILGMIVEKVTGQTLAEAAHERILEPLQLRATYFTPDDPVEGPQSSGYSRARNQSQVAMSYTFATASIVSVPGDLLRFGQALFGGELLEPATMDQMLQLHDGKGSYNMPALQYGLGVMQNVLPVGNAADGAARPDEASLVLGHIGGFGGFRSALWHSPSSGITVALGVNQASTDPNTLATEVWDAVLRAQERTGSG